MPLEIRELHIKMTVNAGQESPEGAPASGPQSGGGGGAPDKAAIVAECIDQILEILREKQEA